MQGIVILWGIATLWDIATLWSCHPARRCRPLGYRYPTRHCHPMGHRHPMGVTLQDIVTPQGIAPLWHHHLVLAATLCAPPACLGTGFAFWLFCLLGDSTPFCLSCLLGDIFWLLGDKIAFLGTGSPTFCWGTRSLLLLGDMGIFRLLGDRVPLCLLGDKTAFCQLGDTILLCLPPWGHGHLLAAWGQPPSSCPPLWGTPQELHVAPARFCHRHQGAGTVPTRRTKGLWHRRVLHPAMPLPKASPRASHLPRTAVPEPCFGGHSGVPTPR